MLQFILGSSGTGKSEKIYKMIEEKSNLGEKCILIVPEQFSSTMELLMYEKFGDYKSSLISVYSFLSFSRHIEKIVGGGACKLLSDAGKIVLTRQVINNLEEDLLSYKKYVNNPTFSIMCSKAIEELKQSGAKPVNLMGINNSNKLIELGYIYAEYETVLSEVGMDSTDRLIKISEKLNEEILSNYNIFIDEFDCFTYPEYELMSKLIINSKSFNIALCIDEITGENNMNLFAPVQKTYYRILNNAKKNNVSINENIVLSKNSRAKNDDIIFLDKFIRNKNNDNKKNYKNIALTIAQDGYNEIKLVSAQIHNLILSGVKHNKIAIICRNIEIYKDEVEHFFNLYNIPYFSDFTKDAQFTSVAVFIRSVIGLLKDGLNTNSILTLLKTELTSIDNETISELENYAFVWKLKANDWRNEFINSPSGIVDHISCFDQKLLKKLEANRSFLIERLQIFIEKSKNQPANIIIKEIYLLMLELKVDEKILKQVNILKNELKLDEAEYENRMWDKTIELLDELSSLLGCEFVTPIELDEFFVLLLKHTEIGSIPKTNDQVVFGSADRMRTNEIEYAFVIGLNETVFPQQIDNTGLLSYEDRDLLIKSGVQMNSDFENEILLEDIFLYRALTTATSKVYLSCNKSLGVPNVIFNSLLEFANFNSLKDDIMFLATTREIAVELLADNYGLNSENSYILKKALELDGKNNSLLCEMQNATKEKNFNIADTKYLKKLLGDKTTLSPSQIEKYYKCNFSYFLEYVLKIKNPQVADINAMQAGSYVHYILENSIKQNSANLTSLVNEDISEIILKLSQEYIQNVLKGIEITLRLKALIHRLNENILDLLLFIQEEQMQSEFKPVDFELEISDKGKVKPLVFTTQDGKEIKLRGKIDRVDVYKDSNGNSYIRIVDYKTGTTEFKLNNVYNGINTQMLFYLYALQKNASNLYINPQNAGVIYLLSDPAPTSTTGKEYKVSGYILENDDIIEKMSSQKSKKFIPLKSTFTNEKMQEIQNKMGELVIQMAEELQKGNIEAKPLIYDKKTNCSFCEYKIICKHKDGIGEKEMQEYVKK